MSTFFVVIEFVKQQNTIHIGKLYVDDKKIMFLWKLIILKAYVCWRTPYDNTIAVSPEVLIQ